MRSMLAVVTLLFAAVPARADDQPASAASADQDAALKAELEKALQADKKPDGTAAAATATQPAPLPTGGRAGQSLNPDISAIVDANGGYERRAPSYRSGDDPDLRGTAKSPGAGFTIQEVEIALSAIVDPYLKGEVYLTIPNQNGLEVDEAVITTTSLPGNFQVRAGSFRGAFGRQNGQHLHVQDFTRRPLVNAAFLGEGGMRGPGLQASWLAPTPFYLAIFGEAFSLAADLPGAGADVPPLATFGGGRATDLTYAVEAKAFFPFGDAWSVYLGASGATGKSPVAETLGRRSVLAGGDLYVKWKPANQSGGYHSLAWQTEAMWRWLDAASGLDASLDGGLYSQLVLQLARSWLLGVRGDVLGLPESPVVGRVYRESLSLTYVTSEFARLRLYGEAEQATDRTSALQPTVVSLADPKSSFAAYLQLEMSIGAHGAHEF